MGHGYTDDTLILPPGRAGVTLTLPSLPCLTSLRSARARLALPEQAGVKIGQHFCHILISLTVKSVKLQGPGSLSKGLWRKVRSLAERRRVLGQIYLADLTVESSRLNLSSR